MWLAGYPLRYGSGGESCALIGLEPGGVRNGNTRRETGSNYLISKLASMDALTMLLIDKGIITQQEFLQKIFEARVTYQRMLKYGRLQSGYLPVLFKPIDCDKSSLQRSHRVIVGIGDNERFGVAPELAPAQEIQPDLAPQGAYVTAPAGAAVARTKPDLRFAFGGYTRIWRNYRAANARPLFRFRHNDFGYGHSVLLTALHISADI